MKTLIVGNGAREHAIAWALSKSSRVSELLVAPGNAGTSALAENAPVVATDIDGLLDLATKRGIELTVVGPEAPLAAGIVDRFRDAGLAIFGPTQAAAKIESSKAFAKELMQAHGIPTGDSQSFSSPADAQAYVASCPLPTVVKADGLTAGKGVVIAETRDEAVGAVSRMMENRIFGAAGDHVIIEEFLRGPEVSVFAFVDGEYVSPLVAACDYKRVGDGDAGPNTGGMGGFSPPRPSQWDSEIEAYVRASIIEPAAKAMVAMGAPYTGVLYTGLILTDSGPKVLEFNCRLGDPEAQVIIPRLKSDLAEVIICAAQGRLEGAPIEWRSQACVGVVVASGGYPGDYDTGHTIHGLDQVDPNVTVFHAGTAQTDRSEVTTDGGRVLTVAATGETLDEARSKAYDNIGRIRFTGSFYRHDIAAT